MNKADTRKQINADLEAFLKAGGKVTVGSSPKQKKMKLPAKGSQKPFFSWSEPKGRPSNSWDNIVTAD